MIKKILTFCMLPLIALSLAAQSPQPLDYVNTLMGTHSEYLLSNGNTYPAIARPWGMHFFTPQTNTMGNGWVYQYQAYQIKGFKQTHQPSPWMNDYGVYSIMPITGKAVFKENDRQSWFSHKTETAKPHYYSVYLADYDTRTELTVTERAAQCRISYPAGETARLVIDAYDKGSYIKVDKAAGLITGYSTRNSGGVAANFKNYFVIKPDAPIEELLIYNNDTLLAGITEAKGNHSGAVVTFSTTGGKPVHLKMASSFINAEQALLNLQREVGAETFDQTVAAGAAEWNEKLGRIQVQGGGLDAQRTFYSCLYRALCFPQRHYEINAAGDTVHYSPYTGNIEPGLFFAGTGFWDTFRALYPLLNLVYPSINVEMQQGLISAYKESGFLPEWSSPGARGIMIGNNSASVVADAWMKGLRGYDINKLYEALLHGANHEGPHATGRRGVEWYNKLGYVPTNVKINESAARTLEYAYDDYCIYTLGKALGRPAAEINLYHDRAMNYKKLFDPGLLLMRGRLEDGRFETPFNPLKWGGSFTEGNSWHYSWSVFQDVQGLINLMGGNTTFTRMLDSVFIMPPKYDSSYYGFTIHEIREMQIMGMGQYAHGNQPIQHMPYLYNYAGQPWKTQYHVRNIMNKLYHPGPDGYCGDEDNGQTSAWYVFSAMGFYPVCPGSNEYVLGAPLFNRVDLKLENGKTLTILGKGNSSANIYVDKLRLRGKTLSQNFVTHEDLKRGGRMVFSMAATPNTVRGTAKADKPFSMTE